MKIVPSLRALIAFFLILYVQAASLLSNPNEVVFGPQTYHLTRIRKGGTNQDGMLYGWRSSYDYIRRYKFYWGAEGAYGRGTLRGKSGNDGSHLKSRFTEYSVEGRLGYTLQTKGEHYSFTPFVGLGYFLETNHYIKPSPVGLHFNNRFYYGALGFLSHIWLTENLKVGARFTAEFSYDGKVKVSHDPHYQDVDLHYLQKIHYWGALPIDYRFCLCDYAVDLRLEPFFEFRNYGKKIAIPFDFQETKIYLYGATLQYLWCF